MLYKVEVAGETIEVDVRAGSAGPEVSVAGEPHQPALLRGGPAPLYTLELGDARDSMVVAPDPMNPGGWLVQHSGQRPLATIPQDARALAAGGRAAGKGKAQKLLRAAMPGVIVELRVKPGDAVTAGQVVLILEAMKMQNEIAAVADAVVKTVYASVGGAVAGGDKLIEFEPTADV